MATPGGTDDSAVEPLPRRRPPAATLRWSALLREVPQEFEFFQAVRLFERLLPQAEPVGGFAPPAKEAIRLRAHASLPFPASQIQRVDWPPGWTARA